MEQMPFFVHPMSVKSGRLQAFCAFLLMLALLFTGVLPACGGGGADDSALTLSQMLALILESQRSLPPLMLLHQGEENFTLCSSLYFEENSALSEALEDGILCAPAGAYATEIAVLRMTDAASVQNGEKALRAYLENRAAVFNGYAPEQAALAEKGRVRGVGNYLALFLCDDPASAEEAFLRCFEDDPPLPSCTPEELLTALSTGEDRASDTSSGTSDSASSQSAASSGDAASVPSGAEFPFTFDFPHANDRYDHDAILAAWKAGVSGEAAGLTERNAAVLSVCRYVIEHYTNDGMLEEEKELAIHDWMIEYGDYDKAVLYPQLGLTPDPDGDSPFGFLLSRKGICLGYTTTFQLFMDLLDIECVTVRGYARETEDHAWNMVKLSSEDWCCVDVTWDDPAVHSPEELTYSVKHQYFNVTCAFMRRTGHSWDEDAAPYAP